MSPIDYLRGVRVQQAALPPAPEPKTLPTLTWANAVTTNGGCIHQVIYSSCRCDQRKQDAQ